jgi:hypothetical protein
MYIITGKSLLSSLCQREEITPLWKKGARGDYWTNVRANIRPCDKRRAYAF